MKKTNKSKAKPKSKPAKKAVAKKVVKKKVAVKTKVKSKAKPKAKVVAKAKPKVKVKAKAKAKAKPVAKAKQKVVKKAAPVKVKPVAKAAAPKQVAPKEVVVKKPATVAPAKPPVTVGKIPYKRERENVRIIRKHTPADPNKTRYSDMELEEFRAIINKKLEAARKELVTLQAQLTSANEHGTDDTANTFKMLEDGSDSLAKEEAGQLASRQRKFIEQLENALVRIENKTYGICRVTGKLIPKERLRAVPHTTQSIEAKLNQYRD